ncbi:type 1 glutamine amidotransferase [Maliponia aquimaris]|uniref:GMP synthase [glutamine-hydrolyzing] n=1 Tax=Maliponia aquimaris TaxID=1673631 RepID=A0A238KBV7_9RHOB|nr:type 1 glutamine amidotransferase [Maliponia aquimaris]SMX40311.1 GMP synthase [glutamine-hydrolyzing] [Maliponia aquimaris]
MPAILIVNGNAPGLIAAGDPDYGALFDTVLRALDPLIGTRQVYPDLSALAEADLVGNDGVIFTGSSTHYSADAAEVAPHRTAMERVFARGLPVWGSCNGMQLAAVVLGGRVGTSPKGVEIGLARDLSLTPEGVLHPMMVGRSGVFTACTIHRDEVQLLPTGATLTVSNAHSPVQAFAYDRGGVDFRGTQYHPEVAPALIARLLRQRGEDGPLAADLDAAETDPLAAARLGATCAALRPETRATELKAWLAHVHTRSPQVGVPA